jgi:hypothetical protein
MGHLQAVEFETSLHRYVMGEYSQLMLDTDALTSEVTRLAVRLKEKDRA